MMASPPTNGPTNGPLSSPPPESPGRQTQDLSYMHRPPTIMPNYGKGANVGGAKLKTNIPRVLLYDNVTQQTILDFQISGLKSQQYKTYREMEMHMRSFSMRSKHRDRALRNITKVQHFDDYEEFLEEFERHEAEEAHKHKRTLPRINGSRISMVSSSPTRRKKTRTIKTRNSAPNIKIEMADSGVNNSVEGGGTPALLPRIENLSSVSLVSAKSQSSKNGKSCNFDPKRNVGFKMEKADSGVTRMFHTLPATEEHDHEHDNEHGQQPAEVTETTAESEPKPEEQHNVSETDAIGAISKANTPEEKPVEMSKQGDQPEIEPIVVPTVEIVEDNYEEFDTDRPVEDFRFAKLERALVPQDPPNDGFIELSPSFVRRYPDASFLETFKRPHDPNKDTDKARGLDAKSRLSGYSNASDGNLDEEDDDDDDENQEEAAGEDNDALKRLGNC